MLTMTITERDKKLLRFLAVFLILLGFIVLILLPMLDKLDSLDAQATELATQKTEMEDKIISLPVYEAENEELKTEFKKAAQSFYAMMPSQEIDRMLTGMALGYSLEVVEMDISMPTEPAVMTPYLYSNMELNEQMEADIRAKEDEAAGETDASGQAAGDAAAAEAETASEGADSQEVQSASSIYAANITMGVEGSKENIQAFIDSLNYDSTSMLVTKYQMDETEKSADAIGGHHLNISIAVYMYNS